jgi:hypothetical protein
LKKSISSNGAEAVAVPSAPLAAPSAPAARRQNSIGSTETWFDVRDDANGEEPVEDSSLAAAETVPVGSPTSSSISVSEPASPTEEDKPPIGKCKVLYDYEAQHPDELTIQPGTSLDYIVAET